MEALPIAALASTIPADIFVAIVLEAPESLPITEVATETLSNIADADVDESLESLCAASRSSSAAVVASVA